MANIAGHRRVDEGGGGKGCNKGVLAAFEGKRVCLLDSAIGL